MPYTTPGDLRGVLTPSATPETDLGSAASMTDAQLEEFITEAQDEIDVVLSGRYPTPFDDPAAPKQIPVPPVVQRIARDIACYLATLTFRKGAALEPTHPVILRYNAAQALLKGIATGSIDLDLPSGWEEDQPAEAAMGGVRVVDVMPGRMFTGADFGISPALPGSRRLSGPFDTPY